MSSKSTIPTWLLTEDWGVGTDPYNWILYRRGKTKEGNPGVWKSAGYYATPEKLLMSHYRKLTRALEPDADLVRHLEHCSERVQRTAARLSEELNSKAWKRLSRPLNHPKTGKQK